MRGYSEMPFGFYGPMPIPTDHKSLQFMCAWSLLCDRLESELQMIEKFEKAAYADISPLIGKEGYDEKRKEIRQIFSDKEKAANAKHKERTTKFFRAVAGPKLLKFIS